MDGVDGVDGRARLRHEWDHGRHGGGGGGWGGGSSRIPGCPALRNIIAVGDIFRRCRFGATRHVAGPFHSLPGDAHNVPTRTLFDAQPLWFGV